MRGATIFLAQVVLVINIIFYPKQLRLAVRSCTVPYSAQWGNSPTLTGPLKSSN